MSTNRRSFLGRMAVLPTVAGLASLPKVANAREEMSAQERMKFHLKEFQKAAEEFDPRIISWRTIDKPHGGNSRCAFHMEATRRLCPYSGDGYYYADNHMWCPKVYVELTPDIVDGERFFVVTDDIELLTRQAEAFGRKIPDPAKPPRRWVIESVLDANIYMKDA